MWAIPYEKAKIRVFRSLVTKEKAVCLLNYMD